MLFLFNCHIEREILIALYCALHLLWPGRVSPGPSAVHTGSSLPVRFSVRWRAACILCDTCDFHELWRSTQCATRIRRDGATRASLRVPHTRNRGPARVHARSMRGVDFCSVRWREGMLFYAVLFSQTRVCVRASRAFTCFSLFVSEPRVHHDTRPLRIRARCVRLPENRRVSCALDGDTYMTDSAEAWPTGCGGVTKYCYQ